MYKAIITPIVNIRNHPNGDYINLGTASGYQVIIGKDTKEGVLGVFFPTDGQLSHEMCVNNSLYSTNPKTGKKMGGFFGKNRKVRAQRFRGEISEGFWMPLSGLIWTGIDLSKLEKDYEFTELNEKLVTDENLVIEVSILKREIEILILRSLLLCKIDGENLIFT